MEDAKSKTCGWRLVVDMVVIQVVEVVVEEMVDSFDIPPIT